MFRIAFILSISTFSIHILIQYIIVGNHKHPLKISSKTRSFFAYVYSHSVIFNVLCRWTLNTNWISKKENCSMVVGLSVYGEYGRKRNVLNTVSANMRASQRMNLVQESYYTVHGGCWYAEKGWAYNLLSFWQKYHIDDLMKYHSIN